MLSPLDLLYIVLIIFTTIIGTLVIITLLRIIKILWPLTEIADFYNKIKQVLAAYKQIPEIIKEKVKETLWKNEEEEK